MTVEDAYFGVTVKFTKGASDPIRVFEGLAELLQGFKTFDEIIIGVLDPQIEPTLVLERVESASITAWVRNRLRQIDDQPIKDFDWKKLVGAFALKAKHRALEYLDARVEAQETARLQGLRDDLQKLAKQAEFRTLPLPLPIELDALVQSLDQIQDAKAILEKTDRVIFKSVEGTHEMNLNVTKRPSEFLPVEKGHKTSGEMNMALLVRRPDYLGDSKWEFKHDKNTISANLLDDEWLRRFREGQEVIVPGSALVCTVAYEWQYDDAGKLQSARHDVIKVHKIITQSNAQQASFW